MSQSMALCHLAYITEKNRGLPSPFQFQLRERTVAVSEHAEQSDALAFVLIQAHTINKKAPKWKLLRNSSPCSLFVFSKLDASLWTDLASMEILKGIVQPKSKLAFVLQNTKGSMNTIFHTLLFAFTVVIEVVIKLQYKSLVRSYNIYTTV